SGFERAQRGLGQRSGGRNEIRYAAVPALDGDTHRRRTEALQVLGDEFVDALRRLVRHKAKSEFGARPRGDDRLAAFALVTAGQAVDLKRRPRGALFLRRVAAFAEQFRDTEKFPVRRFVKRNSGELFSFVGRERNYVVVETGDGNAAIFVAESGEQLA